MSSQQHIAIVGAGFSGLTLVLLFARLRAPRVHLTLIDPYFDEVSRKTLCFWGDIPKILEPFIHSTWHEAEVRTTRRHHRARLHRNPYHRIDEQRLIHRALHTCRTLPEFSMLPATVLRMEPGPSENSVTVVTNQGSQSFDWVFSSLRESSSVAPRLVQHFGGWEVKTPQATFDEQCVTLMDFTIPGGDGSAFFYVVPSDPQTALIEYTQVSELPSDPSLYDDAIRKYLHRRGIDSYRIVRKEHGVIPMDIRPEKPCLPRVIRIGRAGGLTKPSTGYTVRRTVAHLESLLQSWCASDTPAVPPPATGRFAWYDQHFLDVLIAHPNWGERLFGGLLTDNAMDDVLDFLDEKTHLGQELRLFRALPFLPFVAQALFGARSGDKKAFGTWVEDI